jgi:hypothetical protein
MKWTIALVCLGACRSSVPQPERDKTVPVPEETATSVEPDVKAPAIDAAPAVPGPDRPVVSFGGASVFGADSFVILPDGSARFSFERPGKPAEVKSGMISPEELRALVGEMKAARCCALTSQRTMGVPDEGHTTLYLGFPDLVCSVSLWDNEWHELASAAACAKPLGRLRRRLK